MPRPPVLVRLAETSDVPMLFAIRTSVVENAMTLEELRAEGVTHEAVSELLQSGRAAAWLAHHDGQIGGFAMARAEEGDVFALFVLPSAQGHGLGTALLRSSEHWLAARGIATAWLLTGGEPGLRAPGFYAARGWRPVAREADGQIRFVKDLTNPG